MSTATLDRTAIQSRLEALKAEVARRSGPKRLEASIPDVCRPLLSQRMPDGRPVRYKGMHGGRGGMKSHTLARLLLLYALRRPGLRWVCVREIQLTLKESVKRLLDDLIKEYDLGDRFESRETQIITPGDGLIFFQGMQNHNAQSIKSLEGLDGAWFEEAQSASERSLELLLPTIRKEYDDGTWSELWFSWNPEKPTDPIDKLLRNQVVPLKDAMVLQVNWNQNPYFPAVLRSQMETDYARDPESASHIWGGEYRSKSQAAVFKNWRVYDFDTPPDTKFLFGADWGFSVDPTVLVRAFIAEGELRAKLIAELGLSGRPILCLDREQWGVGVEIDDTPAFFDQLDPERPQQARAWEIVADSARPETISYMQRHGYPRIVAARKGVGSVEEGIKFLQSYDIVLHTRCTHCKDEFTHYSYEVDKQTQVVLPILADKKNHTIDAVRYLVEKLHVVNFLNW